LLVNGCIPVALNNSEGAGSVLALAWLPGAHLYIQVLGNERTKRLRAGPSHLFLAATTVRRHPFWRNLIALDNPPNAMDAFLTT
ncbi:MAG: hypothetical protein AAF382_02335, partial [Pseudomonadota bacterium]